MEALPELLGESQPMRELVQQIRRLVARSPSGGRLPPVLLEGETGTGKGLIARLLHRLGRPPAGPFVPVNCAAIPETLLEAEMFGFERGAFTDARQQKPGLFQTASGGTIFLDEVGLLPLALQAKLLNVLEDRVVRRLGATRDEPVDAWVITATNDDLQAAVHDRRFRKDLYHRLAVVTLQVPPLRARGADVLLLAEHVLRTVGGDYGARRTLSDDAREALQSYGWPGNVRELWNVIERTLALSEAAVITADALNLPAPPRTRGPAGEAPAGPDDVARRRLLEALQSTSWNISRTAALLSLTRNTVRAHIKRYGLSAPEPAGRPGRSPAGGERGRERPGDRRSS